MTDYYPLIARRVAALADNTVESRRALYERAQSAQLTQLRELDPPLAEPDITRERLLLEKAIRRVEAEAAGHAPAKDGEMLRDAAAASIAGPPNRAGGDRGAVSEAEIPVETLSYGSRPARSAFLAPPTTILRHHPLESRIESPNLAPGGACTPPVNGAAPPDSWPEPPWRPSHRAAAAPAARRPAGVRKILALTVAWSAMLTVVTLAFVLYWQPDRLKVWLGEKSAAQWRHEIVALLPKIVDRVGRPAREESAAAVAQRATLYEEDAADRQGKSYVGSVLWKTEAAPPRTGQPPDVAIRAEIEIPERGMNMTMLLRRNADQALPASHTIEITFKLPTDASFAGISKVPAILMKQAEQTRGEPLAGVTAKVTSGFFLLGLSAADADAQRNLAMLEQRPWFDIPIVYDNGRRAILAIEKGAAGEQAFREAFAAWRGG